MIIQRRSLSSLQTVLNDSHPCKRVRKNPRGKSSAKSSSTRRVAGREARPAICIDTELVQRTIANDAAAWDQLYRMCAPRLYGPAFAVVRNREDAQDAVQDCWLRAYANLKSFQGRSSFSTWLTRIVINSALMILRKKRNHHEASSRDFDEIEGNSLDLQPSDSSPNPEELYLKEERKNLLDTAIANLQPRLRTAVRMGPLRGRSMTEAARSLGISLGAMKARVFHARVALRKSPVLNTIFHRKSELAA